jgi:hypothetical protein
LHIRRCAVQQKRLTNVEAELWIHLEVEPMEPTAQIRGCLVGPHCRGVETVSINYPLKRIEPKDHAENVLVGQIIIPEPNLWTTETPFVYEGNVELWFEGKCVEIKPIRAAFIGRAERD